MKILQQIHARVVSDLCHLITHLRRTEGKVRNGNCERYWQLSAES